MTVPHLLSPVPHRPRQWGTNTSGRVPSRCPPLPLALPVGGAGGGGRGRGTGTLGVTILSPTSLPVGDGDRILGSVEFLNIPWVLPARLVVSTPRGWVANED